MVTDTELLTAWGAFFSGVGAFLSGTAKVLAIAATGLLLALSLILHWRSTVP